MKLHMKCDVTIGYHRMDTRTPREIKKPKFRVYLVAMGHWSNWGEAGTCETY